MLIEDFYIICFKHGLSMDDGYKLYIKYRTNSKKLPDVSMESFKKMIKNGTIVDSQLSKELERDFINAEQNSFDGKAYQKTMELHDKMERLTSPVTRRDVVDAPLLDSIVSGISNVLIDYKIGKTEEEIYNKALEFFNNDVELRDYYMTWYNLFPTKGPKNSGWEKLFFVTYEGVILRINSAGSMKKFKIAARKYDMRTYLIGTYLFIRSHINNGKCFIPKMENFFKVDHQWYLHAVDVIEEYGDNLAAIFAADYSNSTVSSDQGGGMLV